MLFPLTRKHGTQELWVHRFFLRLNVVDYSENQERKILDRWILKLGCEIQSLSHKLLSYKLLSLREKVTVLFTHKRKETSS